MIIKQNAKTGKKGSSPQTIIMKNPPESILSQELGILSSAADGSDKEEPESNTKQPQQQPNPQMMPFPFPYPFPQPAGAPPPAPAPQQISIPPAQQSPAPPAPPPPPEVSSPLVTELLKEIQNIKETTKEKSESESLTKAKELETKLQETEKRLAQAEQHAEYASRFAAASTAEKQQTDQLKQAEEVNQQIQQQSRLQQAVQQAQQAQQAQMAQQQQARPPPLPPPIPISYQKKIGYAPVTKILGYQKKVAYVPVRGNPPGSVSSIPPQAQQGKPQFIPANPQGSPQALPQGQGKPNPFQQQQQQSLPPPLPRGPLPKPIQRVTEIYEPPGSHNNRQGGDNGNKEVGTKGQQNLFKSHDILTAPKPPTSYAAPYAGGQASNTNSLFAYKQALLRRQQSHDRPMSGRHVVHQNQLGRGHKHKTPDLGLGALGDDPSVAKLLEGITQDAKKVGGVSNNDIEEKISDAVAEAIVDAKYIMDHKRKGFARYMTPAKRQPKDRIYKPRKKKTDVSGARKSPRRVSKLSRIPTSPCNLQFKDFSWFGSLCRNAWKL